MPRKKVPDDNNGDEQLEKQVRELDDSDAPDDTEEPTMASEMLTGQAQAQMEATKQAEDERKAREDLAKNRKPTNRTLEEQKAGKAAIASRQPT